jgi:hypothetical protein
MINRGRATHYSTLTVKFTGRYRAADRLCQPHREPSTHLPQINRLLRIVRRGKRIVNCSKESPTVRALVPAVAEVAHHDCSRRRAEERPVDATEYVTRMDSSSWHGIGRVHEKFGAAEVKHGMEKSALGCRAFAARNESVLRSVTAKVFGLGEKAGLRQSRSGSDCSSRRAGRMGSGAPARRRGISLLPQRLTRFITRSRSSRAGQ